MKKISDKVLLIFSMIFLFIIYTAIIMLMAPVKTESVWISYLFSVLSLVFIILLIAFGMGKDIRAADLVFRKGVFDTAVFYALVSMLIYAVLSISSSMVVSFVMLQVSWKTVLALELLLMGIFWTLIFWMVARAKRIEEMEKHTAEKVFQLRSLNIVLQELEGMTEDVTLRRKLRSLAEDVRFSDPMSDKSTERLDHELAEDMETLRSLMAEKKMEEAGQAVTAMKEKLKVRNLAVKVSPYGSHGL